MASQDKLTDFLYNGILAFYPEVAKGIFGLKGNFSFYESWHGFKRFDFLEFALNETKKDTIEEAAAEVRRWKEEGLPPERNIPEKEKLDKLLADLEEKEKLKAAAYEKAKLTKQILLESQKAKEAAEAVLQEIPVAKTEIPPATPERIPVIGIKITPETGKPFQKLTGRVAAAPFRAAVSFGSPSLSAQEPARVAALALLSRGITSDHIEKKISQVDAKNKVRLTKLVEAIKNEEQSFSVQTKLLKRAFPVKDITFLLGPESGLTQAQIAAFYSTPEPGSVIEQAGLYQSNVAVFFNPPESGGIAAVTRVNFFGDIANRAGSQVFGKISSSFLKWGAKKVAGKVAAGAAGKAAAQIVATAVAAPAGPVGWAARVAAWIATEILPKVLGWAKRHFKEIGGALLVGAGIIVGGPIGVGVAVGGGVLFLGTAGIRAAAASVGGFFSAFFSGVLLPAVGIPVLVTLIAIPVVIAIILFIINAGAYVVPPSEIAFVEDNPYIEVEKEVSPAGPFENSNLPITVTYTITITAKRGTLTKVGFNHECEVLAEDSNFACPAPLPSSPPLEISPTEPYVYTYSQTYSGANYRDSLVMNSFTVTADVPEELATSATGAASIIIGDPPTGCYNVAGDWPTRERAVITSAISSLVGSAPTFVGRLCKAHDQVNLYYNPARVCGVWGCAPPQEGNNIYFNSGGLGNLSNAIYILAHESGHVLAYGAGSLFQAYLAFPGVIAELPVCTYGGNSRDEGFAEAIARYATNSSCLVNEPNNRRFVETRIFR